MDGSLETFRQKMFAFSLMFVGYAAYSLNRKSVSFTFPVLTSQGLTAYHMGTLISSQNVAYAISKFAGGVLSDKINPWILFSSGLLFSGMSLLLFSSSESIFAFSILMFVNGLSQGCGWPACAKVLKHYYPPSQFGFLWSILSSSSNLALIAGPFLAAHLIPHYSWRFSLVFSGSVGVAIAFVFFIGLVVPAHKENRCRKSAHVSKDNNARNLSKKTKTHPESKDSLRKLLKIPLLWIVSIGYMAVFCIKCSCVDWGQLYLIDELGFSHYVGSAFISSVEIGGLMSGIAAGYITDKMVLHNYPRRSINKRMPAVILFAAVLTVSLHLMQFQVNKSTPQWMLLLIGACFGACTYGPIAIFGVVANEVGPEHLSGTSHAIAALAANIGGILSGLPFSWVMIRFQCTPFLLLEVLSALTTLFMLLSLSFSEKRMKSAKQQ